MANYLKVKSIACLSPEELDREVNNFITKILNIDEFRACCVIRDIQFITPITGTGYGAHIVYEVGKAEDK